MKSLPIYYTPEFKKLWKKVPKEVREKAIKKEALFRKNIFSPLLKTHKLKGILKGFYSLSIDCHWRIVFHIRGGAIYFDVVGTHLKDRS